MGQVIPFPRTPDFARRFDARLVEVIQACSLAPTRFQYHPGYWQVMADKMVARFGPMTRAEIDEKIQLWRVGAIVLEEKEGR